MDRWEDLRELILTRPNQFRLNAASLGLGSYFSDSAVQLSPIFRKGSLSNASTLVTPVFEARPLRLRVLAQSLFQTCT